MKRSILEKKRIVQALKLDFDELDKILSEETLSSMEQEHILGGNAFICLIANIECPSNEHCGGANCTHGLSCDTHSGCNTSGCNTGACGDPDVYITICDTDLLMCGITESPFEVAGCGVTTLEPEPAPGP